MRRVAYSVILIFVFFIGCNKTQKDYSGIYIKTSNTNIFDTLKIFSDSIFTSKIHNQKLFKYEQSFYDKNNKRIFVKKDFWYLDNNEIYFNNFYSDFNEIPINKYYSVENQNECISYYATILEDDKILIGRSDYYIKIKQF